MVIFLLIVSVQGLKVKTGESTVMEKGSVKEEWAPDYSDGFTCHPVLSHIELSETTSRVFEFYNEGDSELMVHFEQISTGKDGYVLHPMLPIYELKIPPQTTQNLTLIYNCESGVSQEPWDTLTLSFASQGFDHKVKYIKICDDSGIGSFDWSMIILLAIAIVVVGLSAWSVKLINVQGLLPEENNQLTTWHAVGFLLCGSLALIVMFFLIYYISIILTIMVAIGGTIAMTYTFAFCVHSFSSQIIRLPIIGEVSSKHLACAFIGFLIMAFYLYTKNWVLSNIIGVCYCFLIIRSFRIMSLKVGALLLGLLFAYDIFWVFYSADVFGANVMVTVATGLDLPIKIVFPHLLAYPIQHTCGLIGLGDLAIPGLFIAFAARLDTSRESRYYYVQMACYSVALILCFGVLILFDHAQPALLYISPMLVFGLILHAAFRSELGEIWKGENIENSDEIAMMEYN